MKKASRRRRAQKTIRTLFMAAVFSLSSGSAPYVMAGTGFGASFALKEASAPTLHLVNRFAPLISPENQGDGAAQQDENGDATPPENALRVVSHIVRSGQTLSHLASSYGTGVGVIMVLNNLRSDELHIGQELFVPARGVIKASWYGKWFNGRPMANTQPYHTTKLVIAHRYLPLGTCVRLTNPENGNSVVATVEDRIAARYAYRWDLSPRVFRDELGIPLGVGVAQLEYEIVNCEENRLAQV